MMQMPPVDQDSVLNLLHLIRAHSRWFVLVSLLIVNAIFGALTWFCGRKLRPRLISLALARTQAAATEILQRWGALKPSARRCIRADFFLIPSYVALLMYLCFWAAGSLREPVNWLAVIGFLVGCFTVVAGLFDVIENIGMLRTLRRAPTEGSVAVTRICAWAKLGLLAIVGLFLVFRAEYFVYELFKPWVQESPHTTISVMAILTIILGIRFLRIAASLHPPLLMLQMARSPEAAMRVVQRWKPDFVAVAARANVAEMWFALGYAVTLGVVAFRISPPLASQLPARLLHGVARGVAWFLLLAGTLHLVQNIASAFAIRAKGMADMRWWVGLGSRCGRLRITFLILGGTWLFMMLLWWESRALKSAGDTIRKMIGT